MATAAGGGEVVGEVMGEVVRAGSNPQNLDTFFLS